MFEKLIPYDVAHIIINEYINYYHLFKRITKRAQIRFENRDWHGIQQDAKERINLYRKSVGNTVEKIMEVLGAENNTEEVWQEVKQMYYYDIKNFNTRNIAETYYNSVFRHSHKGLGADSALMFVHATGTYREFRSMEPIYHTIYLTDFIETSIHQLFTYYQFDCPFEDFNRDVKYIIETLSKKINQTKPIYRTKRLEVLHSVFYRNKGAYIVGRLYLNEKPIPFVFPLLNEANGIYVDALLLEFNDVSSIFSYTRSYFLVDVDIVSETVDFLRTIIPTKSLGEMYNSIGFEKHGKTVFYRDFVRHMEISNDKFVTAPGTKGMVMSVFTLPSYEMVFKIIMDEFEPPKNITEDEVKEKYQLVNEHDRVGRMTDSHMFENLVFKRNRFSPKLIKELLEDAPSKIILKKNTLEIKHLYVEKRMIPLDLYLETANPAEIKHVINEYGKAIKQLAAVNIFPGDMLLKNFGVTKLNRVVFYDYDEIGFLTDYNFRIIPEPRDEYEEMSSTPYYHVGPNDVFPEEFPQFLVRSREVLQILLKLHGNLFKTRFWKSIQSKLKRGEIVDVFPYRVRLRFKNKYRAKKSFSK